MINRKNTLTSLNHWFPIISQLGIPVPKTEIVECPDDIRSIFDGRAVDVAFAERLKQNAARLGYPVFMRTDLCSGKHDWKNTCFVKDESALFKNLESLLYYNELADMMGLPYTSIVLREFLDLEISFKAFSGEMPVNKERRYFVDGGKLLCHHPYWPAEAFEDGHCKHPGWERELEQLNYEDSTEVNLLTEYAETAGKALGGFWSVDFAKTKNHTWYLIDMAVGEASYHWPSCPNENRRIRE